MTIEADATATPAVAATPSIPQEPAAPAKAASVPIGISAADLKLRLDETREKAARDTLASVAKDLGLPVEEAKALIAKAKAAEDANKSDVERLTAEKAALAAKTVEFDEYKGAVEIRAKAELGLLADDQRAAVLALAGEHPARQLKAIETLRPTWQSVEQSKKAAEAASAEAARLAAEAQKAAEAAAAVKPPIGAPASTTGAAPPAPKAPPAIDVLATWEKFQADGLPHRAASFYLQHQQAISAAQRARAAT